MQHCPETDLRRHRRQRQWRRAEVQRDLKIPLYLGTSPLPLPPVPPQIGFWAVLHEIRSEYAQLASCAFLLLAGPGQWSVDALLARRGLEKPTFKADRNL